MRVDAWLLLAAVMLLSGAVILLAPWLHTLFWRVAGWFLPDPD